MYTCVGVCVQVCAINCKNSIQDMYISTFAHTNIVKIWLLLNKMKSVLCTCHTPCGGCNETFSREQPTPSHVELFTLTDDVISLPSI